VGVDGRPSSWIAQNSNTPVFVVSNRMKVSNLVVGVSDGPFKKIDAFPNTLGPDPGPGKSLGDRPWGTARVHLPVPGGLAISGRPSFVSLAILPNSLPPAEQLLISGFDAGGKRIVSSSGRDLSIMDALVPVIKRWEVQSRPFHYVVFKDVHLDPN
jgi:hypothetical protein